MVESRGFSCHAFIGFLIGLFIPLWLQTGNSFKSLGKVIVTLMGGLVGKGEEYDVEKVGRTSGKILATPLNHLNQLIRKSCVS